jgi:hypothetical protein
MKRWIPILVLIIAAASIAIGWLPKKSAPREADLATFGKIPVLVGGRVKPLDTVARNSLLIIHSKQELRLPVGASTSAMQLFKIRRCWDCSDGNRVSENISASPSSRPF